MKPKWNKVTEVLPEDGKSYLVWTGQEIIVSMAHVYDQDTKKQLAALADDPRYTGNNEDYAKRMRNATGKFADFGLHWYFDNPRVYWAELPEGPV